MTTMQKIGFVGFPVSFMLTGLVCLIAGLYHRDTTLTVIGVFLPLGLVQLVWVLVHFRRHRDR